MMSLPIGCIKFLFRKLFVTPVCLGSYPHYKLGVLIHLFIAFIGCMVRTKNKIEKL
jgi:hypothetical protein